MTEKVQDIYFADGVRNIKDQESNVAENVRMFKFLEELFKNFLVFLALIFGLALVNYILWN